MIEQFKSFYNRFMPLFDGYHIIVVPKDKAQTKTLKVSGFSLKVLIASVVLSVPLFLVSVLSTIHYQNKLVAVKRDTYENQKLLKNKQEFISKIAILEKKIALMDDSLANLGEVMDVDVENMRAGLGPVADTDLYLPEDEMNSALESLDADPDKLVNEWIENNGNLSTDKFTAKMASLQNDASFLNKKMQDLFDQSKDKIRFAGAIPNELPIGGWVTSEFGMRNHPLSHNYKMHEGIDIASPSGSPIKAPADGVVIYAGYAGGYGQVVVLDHGYGIVTLYAHASKLNVKLGDRVSRGKTLSFVGNTGASTGPHVHYEVRVDGIPTDPMSFVAKK